MASKRRVSSKRALPAFADVFRRSLNSLRAFVGVAMLALLAGCFAAEEEPEQDTSPLLYEITGPEGEVEGWMLGTIHLLPDGVAWRTPAIDRVVADADVLVVEIANLEDGEAISRLFVELGTTHGMPELLDRVPPSERAALEKLVERAGLSPGDFGAIETWAAALMLAQGDAIGSAENGVDRVILEDFDDREIREFEGATSQLSIFDRLSEEDQRVLLSATIVDREEARQEAQDLLDAWLKGDEKTIETLTTTGAMEDEDIRNALLVDRNTAWIGKLAPMLRAPEKPLVAVGAAHLVGPDGLPAMLEKRGYTVRRLPAGAQ